MSTIQHLQCSQCNTQFDHHEIQTFCTKCNKPLLAEYDLERAASLVTKEKLKDRKPDLWRYREFLPLLDEKNKVTLGEGFTPLIPLNTLAKKSGVEKVWVKDEAMMPTGSFKARGLAMAVSKAKELGIARVAIPTAGNAGGALAAYAARAHMQCHIFMPKDTPHINFLESKITGAEVTLIEGLISDCGKIVADGKKERGWFDVSTLKEPYRLEGKKTMGLELAEQFDWQLPDVIIYPTGGGTGLIGMWKAFNELQEIGWISDRLPRMIAVQSSGCDPITRAFRAGKFDSAFFEGAETMASGLRVPKAFGDTLILRAIHESGGHAVSVADEEILKALEELAIEEGILVCPEGAATWAALQQLRESNEVYPTDQVVLFNTGSGLKYPEVLTMIAKRQGGAFA